MAKPRAYVGAFTLRLGPFSTQGALLPIRRNLRSKFVLCTPGEAPQPVRQCYLDPDGKTWWESELGRADKDKDGNLTPVSPEAVAAAKTSDLPLNYMELTAHPVADVRDSLFPADSNAYVFNPVIKNSSGKVVDNPVNVKIHDLINVLVRENTELAFVGRCNLNNYEGIYRLGMHQGHIMLQKQLHPEEVNQYEFMAPEVTRSEKAKGQRIVDALTSPYDDATYADNIGERLAKVADMEFDPAAAYERTTTPVEVDLESMLDAALADFG